MKKFFKESKAYLYLLPALIILAIFVFYPLINSFILSLTYKGGFSFKWYEVIFKNDTFIKALTNTLIYAFITTPLSLLISLVISFALNYVKKLNQTFQVIFFLPYVTSTIAIGLVFLWMFHSNYGIINHMISAMGLTPQEWLTNPALALPTIIIFGVWKGLAFNILIIFTALQTIDPNLEKAALIDGASSIKTFIKIKLPQIRPVLIYLLIINVINSLKVYDEVVSLFGTQAAGTGNSGITAVYYIYQQTSQGKFGPAAAAAMVLFAVIFLLTMLNKMISSKKGKGKREK